MANKNKAAKPSKKEETEAQEAGANVVQLKGKAAKRAAAEAAEQAKNEPKVLVNVVASGEEFNHLLDNLPALTYTNVVQMTFNGKVLAILANDAATKDDIEHAVLNDEAVQAEVEARAARMTDATLDNLRSIGAGLDEAQTKALRAEVVNDCSKHLRAMLEALDDNHDDELVSTAELERSIFEVEGFQVILAGSPPEALFRDYPFNERAPDMSIGQFVEERIKPLFNLEGDADYPLMYIPVLSTNLPHTTKAARQLQKGTDMLVVALCNDAGSKKLRKGKINTLHSLKVRTKG